MLDKKCPTRSNARFFECFFSKPSCGLTTSHSLRITAIQISDRMQIVVRSFKCLFWQTKSPTKKCLNNYIFVMSFDSRF